MHSLGHAGARILVNFGGPDKSQEESRRKVPYKPEPCAVWQVQSKMRRCGYCNYTAGFCLQVGSSSRLGCVGLHTFAGKS